MVLRKISSEAVDEIVILSNYIKHFKIIYKQSFHQTLYVKLNTTKISDGKSYTG